MIAILKKPTSKTSSRDILSVSPFGGSNPPSRIQPFLAKSAGGKIST